MISPYVSWNTETGRLRRSLSQHTKPIHSVARRPGTTGLPMVASAASDRTIRFWQPTIGRMVSLCPDYLRKPLRTAWTNDGERLIAVGVDGHLRVVDPFEVTVTRTLPVIDGWAYAIAVHPSDNSVAIGGANGKIRRVELGDLTSEER